SSLVFFYINLTTTRIYPFSLHDALPISLQNLHMEQDFDGCLLQRALRYAPYQPLNKLRHDRQFHEIWQNQFHANKHSHRQQLIRSEEHTSELQSRFDLVCRLLLEKKNTK